MRYTLRDFFEKVIPDAPPTAFLKIDLEEVLIKCLSANFLAYREWEAILGWYRYNLTYNEIAAAWGISGERAHQILQCAERRIRFRAPYVLGEKEWPAAANNRMYCHFDFSRTIRYILEELKVWTITDLCMVTKERFLTVNGSGNTKWNEFCAEMTKHGFGYHDGDGFAFAVDLKDETKPYEAIERGIKHK